MGYADLYRWVKAALDAAHMEGALKAEITADPERFIDADPEMPLALLDQKRAGRSSCSSPTRSGSTRAR